MCFEKTEKEGEGSSNLIATTFSTEKCRLALAKFIIVEEMLFRVVESEGFREYFTILQPKFIVHHDGRLQEIVFNFTWMKKKKLKEFIGKKGLKVSLTTDMWTSIQNVSYMVLTAYLMNDN